MADPQELPLFPLNTVLFPGMTLPLHIFEARYRLMIGRCIQKNLPFGVVLIREGQEVGGPATPYRVGTSAYVTRSQKLADGRLNIVTVGYQRFRLLQVRQTEPFMTAVVDDYPVEGLDDPQVAALAGEMRPVLSNYLKVLIEAAGSDLSLGEIPQDGLALAYFAGVTMPLPMTDKQAILEIRHLPDILRAEQTFLKRELLLLDHLLQPPPAADPEFPFSPN